MYNQATAMTRFYNSPMLLIEFDDKKPFSLQGKYYLSKDLQSSDIVAKLQLLTLHFPKLRNIFRFFLDYFSFYKKLTFLNFATSGVQVWRYFRVNVK